MNRNMETVKKTFDKVCLKRKYLIKAFFRMRYYPWEEKLMFWYKQYGNIIHTKYEIIFASMINKAIAIYSAITSKQFSPESVEIQHIYLMSQFGWNSKPVEEENTERDKQNSLNVHFQLTLTKGIVSVIFNPSITLILWYVIKNLWDNSDWLWKMPFFEVSRFSVFCCAELGNVSIWKWASLTRVNVIRIFDVRIFVGEVDEADEAGVVSDGDVCKGGNGPADTLVFETNL